uniref:Ig-like domain-containing protein n=1 Tax=Phasianus colchicus TaxID=9054 RepID=A0A669QMW9_PHACC
QSPVLQSSASKTATGFKTASYYPCLFDYYVLMAHEGALPAVAIDQKEKQKPELVLVPEPARVLEGETARFRCRVTGYPLPKVNWYLNSQLIRKSKRFRLRYDGIHYLDIVDYVTSDDSASIMVKAVNIAGETSSHAFLLVQGNFKSLTFILLPIIAITLVKPI